MRNVFRQIHLWLSVPFGLIISIICFSGAALVFEDEVTEWVNHDVYYVSAVGTSPLAIEQLTQKVSDVLSDSVQIKAVSISADTKRAYKFNLSKPRRASIYVDQYSGEIKGKGQRLPFFLTMFKLHRWLLDSVKPDGEITWGKMLVGTSTLMFVIVLLSGIVVWWPRTRKALKNSMKIVANKSWPRLWYSLHSAGGMYALIFLLAMALTGLTWSFSWYRTGFYKVFGVELCDEGHGTKEKATTHHERDGQNRPRNGEQRANNGEKRHSPFAHWQQVYEHLKEQNPDYEEIDVSDGTANVSFDNLGNRRATDRYTFDKRSGNITQSTLYADTDNSAKIRGWIYSIHVGSWGGLFTRILAFLAALLGATLPLTGYYLWLKRLYRQYKSKQSVNSQS